MTISLPVTLHIAIGTGEIPTYQFDTLKDLVDFISRLTEFDCVWLMTTDCENCEIVVTEQIGFMCHLLAVKSFHCGNSTLYIQEYPTYEEAYAVALEMKELNPKALNKNP
jgi:hypothetical protein